MPTSPCTMHTHRFRVGGLWRRFCKLDCIRSENTLNGSGGGGRRIAVKIEYNPRIRSRAKAAHTFFSVCSMHDCTYYFKCTVRRIMRLIFRQLPFFCLWIVRQGYKNAHRIGVGTDFLDFFPAVVAATDLFSVAECSTSLAMKSQRIVVHHVICILLARALDDIKGWGRCWRTEVRLDHLYFLDSQWVQSEILRPSHSRSRAAETEDSTELGTKMKKIVGGIAVIYERDAAISIRIKPLQVNSPIFLFLQYCSAPWTKHIKCSRNVNLD